MEGVWRFDGVEEDFVEEGLGLLMSCNFLLVEELRRLEVLTEVPWRPRFDEVDEVFHR